MTATVLPPAVEARVRDAFAGQPFMATIGARLAAVGPGTVTVTCDLDERLTQQHGFVHAGVLTSLADTASGFAALTLVGSDEDVLTADLTVHLLRPATGPRYSATAGVVKHGRTLTVCRSEVHGDTLAAVATVTLATVAGDAVVTTPAGRRSGSPASGRSAPARRSPA